MGCGFFVFHGSGFSNGFFFFNVSLMLPLLLLFNNAKKNKKNTNTHETEKSAFSPLRSLKDGGCLLKKFLHVQEKQTKSVTESSPA